MRAYLTLTRRELAASLRELRRARRLVVTDPDIMGGDPIFRGLFEDNDPKKRLQIIVNYNTDVSQFWEWSGTGLRPIDDTNEAYKLGVNYIIYGLTH